MRKSEWWRKEGKRKKVREKERKVKMERKKEGEGINENFKKKIMKRNIRI